MCKAILMMLLIVVSSSAMAEWVVIGIPDTGTGIHDGTLYADTSTIRKNGNVAKMWVMFDFNAVQPFLNDKAYRSVKNQFEFDCNNEQSRLIYFAWYSGNMGRDERTKTSSRPNNDWEPVMPDSKTQSLLELACGKANGNEKKDAAKTLDRLQPDWRQITDSTAFRNWMATLPKDEQDKLNASWEPYFISAKITEFNKSKAVVSSDSMEDWVKVSSTISTGKNGVNGKEGRILLSGEIRHGDAEIIASTLEKNVIVQLILNSMGGDVAESMKIVSLIKGAHLNTVVAPRGFCASACFFLYLAGDSRLAYSANDDGTLPQIRQAANGGFVGIHRPYLKTPSGESKQKDVMQQVRKYLDSEGVSQHLIDTMMSRPSNDIYWLSERDHESIGKFGAGQEEALISKCGYKRFSKQISEKWTEEQRDRLSACENDYFFKTIDPAKQQFLTKLRTGWRPWQSKKL